MNRKEKRDAVKKLQKVGLKRDAAQTLINQRAALNNPTIEDGDKVKLNVDMIMGSKSWERGEFSDGYVEFVRAHVDTVFTARKDENQKYLFTLDEDENDPKWLWFNSSLVVQDSNGSDSN